MSVQPPLPEQERECPACGASMVVDSRFVTWCWRVVIQTIKFRRKPDPWQAAREFAVSIPPMEWERRRLLGRRRLNRIDVSHPPSMFRGDLLRSRPDRQAAVTLSAERSAIIDAELATVDKAVLERLR